MNRIFIIIMLTVLLLTSCGGAAPTQAPAPTQQPAAPPTETAIPPTDTPLPPTATIAPFPFRDDFEGSLAEGWSWFFEYPTHWNLTDVPGYLRIILQNTNMGAEDPKNFFLRAAPEGNFEITTMLQFTPTSNFQFAGLLIYDEPGTFNAMQFGRAYAQCGMVEACKGNAIYFDIIEGGQGGKPNFATTVPNESIAYLRLHREGTAYSAYYSQDGVEWTLIGQHESALTPKFVGLIGSQAYEAETTADFDYFTIEELP